MKKAFSMMEILLGIVAVSIAFTVAAPMLTKNANVGGETERSRLKKELHDDNIKEMAQELCKVMENNEKEDAISYNNTTDGTFASRYTNAKYSESLKDFCARLNYVGKVEQPNNENQNK